MIVRSHLFPLTPRHRHRLLHIASSLWHSHTRAAPDSRSVVTLRESDGFLERERVASRRIAFERSILAHRRTTKLHALSRSTTYNHPCTQTTRNLLPRETARDCEFSGTSTPGSRARVRAPRWTACTPRTQRTRV